MQCLGSLWSAVALYAGSILCAGAEPSLHLENVVVSSQVDSFDMKVLVDTETPLEPIFIIGVAWDPTALDIAEVSFSGTVFERIPPPLWDPDHLLNLKPDGKPVLGIYTLLNCDPCDPKIPVGLNMPIVNLRFSRPSAYSGDTSTVIHFAKAPGPKTHPELELDTQVLVDGTLTPVPTTDGTAAFLSRVPFLRGDANSDTVLDISDAISTLAFLFLGNSLAPSCFDAANANNDNRVDISDAVYTLNFLFSGGATIPPPYPACGAASEGGAFDCARYPPCS